MGAKQKTLMLLGLDLFGTLLFAIGAFGAFGGRSYWPQAWAFPGDDWVLITAGVALIVPYMVHVVAQGRRG